MDLILQYDEALFKIINGEWHNPILDYILPFWREKKFWYPFYLFLLVFLVYKFRWKGLYLILGLVISLGITDFVSSHILKKNVKRLRPCQDPEIKEDVVLLVGCGRAYSFTSSHAANHFAIATFLVFTLGRRYKKWKWWLYFWAASIAFAQVYVGVHYPIDVIVGSILGFFISFCFSKLYWRLAKIKINTT